MSKESRDERKREMRIKRRREASSFRDRKGGRTQRADRKKPAPKRTSDIQTSEPTSSRNEFSDKRTSMKTELNSLSFRTRNLPSRVNQLDDNIKGISTRINNIRSNRYYSQSSLERMSETISETWKTVSPSIKNYGLEQANLILQRQSDFEANINRSNSLMDLDRFAYQLSDINRDVINIENSVQAQLEEYQNQYHMIDDELKIAEETISNLSNTSINWKNNEHPVLAVKTHDLTNDKRGILTLTNLRILFEEIKEVVIRKNFFFATEKKTTREVILDQPIGSIDEIEKGRVGLLKGAGLFFKFKAQTGLDELKVDTSSNDDDKIIHFYNYIISGEAEKELEPIQDSKDHNAPVKCPNCSAPYSEEILKGQTSVKCIYCGTVIKL
ncbi:hypothetical protein ACFL0D_02660 [Thermoproteota archaeon]